MIGRVSTAVSDTAASCTQPREGGGGTAVPDTAASYHPPPRPFSNKIPRERHTYQYITTVEAASREGAGTTVPDIAARLHPGPTSIVNPRETYPRKTGCGGREEGERARLCQTPQHHTPNQEGLTHAQQRVAAERRGRAGKTVRDTAESYTQPRGRGWERARLCQIPRYHTTRPRRPSQT